MEILSARYELLPPLEEMAITRDQVRDAQTFLALSLRRGATPGPVMILRQPGQVTLFGGLWARYELEEFAQLRNQVLMPAEIEPDAQELAAQRLGTELMLP